MPSDAGQPPDDDTLAAARWQADPPADDAVAAMLLPWQALAPDGSSTDHEAENLVRLAAANRAIATWQRNADLPAWQAPAGTPEPVARALASFVQAQHRLPDWADPAQIARTEHNFMAQGVLSCTLLFCASLPECYVLPDLADVLHTTGQLEQRTEHRIRATAAMIFPVMMDGGLTHGDGGGVAQILKVRLIHAVVRHLVLQGEPGAARLAGAGVVGRPRPPRPGMHQALLALGWDLKRQGLPCNQYELAYTLLTFGYVPLRGQRTLGLGATAADEAACLHSWNVVGHLVGIQPELMAHSYTAAEALFRRLQVAGPQSLPAPDPRPALTAALMNAMAAALPWRLVKPVPRLLTGHLLGERTSAALGLNLQAGLASRALFSLGLGFLRAVDTIARTISPGFSLSRLLTRVIGYHLLTTLLMDQTRPLNLPAHLLPRLRSTVAGWSQDPQAKTWLSRVEERFTGPWPSR